jgi:O-acetyl-ADP-ribose deacetylase (regulator of RNase III)
MSQLETVRESCMIRLIPSDIHPGETIVVAADHACRSVAFPCIATGVYGYLLEPAARIALREARDYLSRTAAQGNGEREMEVVFCCFSERDKQIYEMIM